MLIFEFWMASTVEKGIWLACQRKQAPLPSVAFTCSSSIYRSLWTSHGNRQAVSEAWCACRIPGKKRGTHDFILFGDFHSLFGLACGDMAVLFDHFYQESGYALGEHINLDSRSGKAWLPLEKRYASPKREFSAPSTLSCHLLRRLWTSKLT